MVIGFLDGVAYAALLHHAEDARGCQGVDIAVEGGLGDIRQLIGQLLGGYLASGGCQDDAQADGVKKKIFFGFIHRVFSV